MFIISMETPQKAPKSNFLKWGIYPSIQQALHDILQSSKQPPKKLDKKKSNSNISDNFTKSFFNDMNNPN